MIPDPNVIDPSGVLMDQNDKLARANRTLKRTTSRFRPLFVQNGTVKVLVNWSQPDQGNDKQFYRGTTNLTVL